MSKEKMMEKAFNEVERLIPAESEDVRESVIENSMASALKSVPREEIREYVQKTLEQEEANVVDFSFQNWTMTR